MTERDLAQWGRYAEQKGMPFRRLELLLAQIAMLVDMSRMKTGTIVPMSDYLLGEERTSASERIGATMMAFGGPAIQVRRG